jgi:hypothetical protein
VQALPHANQVSVTTEQCKLRPTYRDGHKSTLVLTEVAATWTDEFVGYCRRHRESKSLAFKISFKK